MANFFEGSTTTGTQDGILQWANSIRHNMSNDSGRPLFQQQVQTHGFLFLDDYLENILSGAKQDPLIELVKTPGRRKVLSKKPKLGSKLGNPISFSLDTAIHEVMPSSKASSSKATLQQEREPAPSSRMVEGEVASSNKKRGTAMDVQPDVAPSSGKEEVVAISLNAEPSNLSIIAEDDENDLRDSPVKKAKQTPHLDKLETHDTSRNSKSRPQSITMNSPVEYHTAQVTPISPTFPPLSLPTSDSNAKETVSEPSQTITPVLPPPDDMDTETMDMEVPLKNEEDTSTKTGILNIPSLPDPGPLRKSVRSLRDPSMGATATFGTTTPAAPKRTSWLIKAREVNALGGTAKKPSSTFQHPPITPAVTMLAGLPVTSAKRKSEDITTAANPVRPTSQGRNSKASKSQESDTAPLKSTQESSQEPEHEMIPKRNDQPDERTLPSPQGVLDRLKKTVEDLGARTSKTKSEESEVIHMTFAEAKAAAKARIAERNKGESPATADGMSTGSASSQASRFADVKVEAENRSHSSQEAPRLSMSELFPPGSHIKDRGKSPNRTTAPSQPKSPMNRDTGRESTSTTPPHSPPPVAPPTAVFTKPPPVFVPPPQSKARSPTPKESIFQPPRAFPSMQPSLGLGLSRSPTFNAFKPPSLLTAQSTMDNLKPGSIFDKDEAATWVPATRDTQYAFDSQVRGEQAMVCDEDDSWPVDEKLAAGVQWTFGGKEDSMTWSTLPSQSTGPPSSKSTASLVQVKGAFDGPLPLEGRGIHVPGAFDIDMIDEEPSDDEIGDDEFEEVVFGGPKISDAKTTRPQSQLSMAASTSSQSQSQGGFFNQASKLFSSAMGTNKKKPEVKQVMQLAAVAAKKQQEEADKKAARLKEMEMRRQAALQRKAEEEKAKSMEEERKVKEELERRKREREESANKRPVTKATATKRDEETLEKKKLESAKKPSILKKTTSGTLGKSQFKQPLKPSSTLPSFSTPSNAAASSSKVSKPTGLPGPSSLKGKSKQQQQQLIEDEISQPSQLLQGQMAARAKAQMKAAKQSEPVIPSEAIELPDINSEYSDSEDEDRPRTFDPPDWAQSPELKQALEMQSTINPDDIFGAVKPLKMEEIFKTRTSRFRARTSSANWTGTDMLTLQEEREYAKRMGFK